MFSKTFFTVRLLENKVICFFSLTRLSATSPKSPTFAQSFSIFSCVIPVALFIAF